LDEITGRPSPSTDGGSGRREWLANSALIGASSLAFLLFCEFVVFRVIWQGSDVPDNAFVNEVVRYAPHQRGTWRVRAEIAAPYAINAQGWNSGSGDLVAGMRGHPAEAYRFAVARAPMSQYLHMIEREVEPYRPDWVIVLLVHNDFDESFRFTPGRYTSSFRKLRLVGGEVLGEVPRSRGGVASLTGSGARAPLVSSFIAGRFAPELFSGFCCRLPAPKGATPATSRSEPC
jgi:hypothetical protein